MTTLVRNRPSSEYGSANLSFGLSRDNDVVTIINDHLLSDFLIPISRTEVRYKVEKTDREFVTSLSTFNEVDKKLKNFEKLNIIKDLDANWDNYGAQPFSSEFIDLCKKFIIDIHRQPEVFPTARQSIQFEYEKENGEYLELEIFEDRVELFKMLKNGEEIEEEFALDITKINESVINFYE